MSEENIALARRMYATVGGAISSGKAPDDLDQLLDPEVEWIPINAALEGSRYRGLDGVRQWIAEMNREWEYFEAMPDEFRELGGGRLLALGTWRAKGRSSGVELDSQPATWLLDLRDGRVVRLHTFTDRAKAFKAAGLDE
jgi:ketosteroid isomerase-like protein